MSQTGKVYIIGAGCAEYDLITLRGIRVLKRCDTVVYDYLTDRRLLDYAPLNSEKICVGKRAGRHSHTQDDINRLIINKALEGKTVARLKGGDPFVFGRAGEEIAALKEYRIPYTVIPGISSAIAAAELSGIPVTHRNISRGFHVITGHTSKDLLYKNLGKYANLNETLVILMGFKNLKIIANTLIASGMKKDTPAAVITNCGYENEQIVRESIFKIADAAEKAKLTSPAVIVIGETASFDFSSTYHELLSGISVTVTGTKRIQSKLASMIEEIGGKVYKSARLDISECDDYGDFDNALRCISLYKTLVLTSPNGAEVFLKRLKALKIDIRKIGHLKIAVIGSETAKVLESIGLYCDIIPEKYTSKALGEAVAENTTKEEQVLILRSSEGSGELVLPLMEKSIAYDDIISYRPVYAKKAEHSNTCKTDYIIFCSAGGVKNYFLSGGEISHDTKIICIGEVTAGKLREYTDANCKIPDKSTANGIINLILEDTENEAIQKAENKPSNAQDG